MKYTTIFANYGHKRIKSLAEIKRNSEPTVGFYVNGVLAGEANLYRPIINGKRRLDCLQTEYTGLYKKFRRKGHGIHLYLALVRIAKRLGVKRLYSSRSLNDLSRRMWAVKLRKYYSVNLKTKIGEKCSHPGCQKKHMTVDRYFIEF